MKHCLKSNSDFQAYILPVSKQLGEVAGLAIDGSGRLVAFHRADREWDEKSFDEKEKFNKKLGPIKNATITVIDPSNGKNPMHNGLV
ncbi:hypothetical protein ANCCAN_16035 [Ancylostoma caninum]|uniref:Uncharacterized protein n=1 Tax=Ancylostoma caninum TaxID=29170 RepID=A0A368G0T8_ANCCA|nr:hypothetical protein ANCCAN_16035 [Ancylostoma caninum]